MVTYNLIDKGYDICDFDDDLFSCSPGDLIHNEYPYLQVYEGNNEIEVRAALPGISRDDINIEIKEDILTIEGEKRPDYTASAYLRKERTFGKFRKSIELPYEVDSKKVDAEFKDGFLTLKMPKSEHAMPKKIEIR
jgi:HSP20 family protein